MKNKIEFKGRITTKKAIKMLKKEGLQVTTEEADHILVFLRKLANIAVTSYLKNNDSKTKQIDTSLKKEKVKNKTKINYCKPYIIVNNDLKT